MKSSQIHKVISEGGKAAGSRQEVPVRWRQTKLKCMWWLSPALGPGAGARSQETLLPVGESNNKGASDASWTGGVPGG